MLGLITVSKIEKYEGWTPQGIGKSWCLDGFFWGGIIVKASGPSMMGQKVAAEVAKAQLLHSKGGALSKTTTFVSWIAFTTNHRRAFGEIFFAHHYFLQARPHPTLVFSLQNCCCPAFQLISQNALGFSSLKFSTNPAQGWTFTQGPPSQFRFLKFRKGRRRKNKQTKTHEDTWTLMNTHEKPWAPRRTHEFKCIPAMFSWFVFRTNAAGNLYVQHVFTQFLI